MTRPTAFAYRRLVRPVLFRAGKGDPETVHHRTLAVLSRVSRSKQALAVLRRLHRAHPAPRTVFGVDFPSAVGLAAGMDKDGVALKAWAAMGFGFVEVGTVTTHAQQGNPRPRLFRLTESESIINRMGFNNAGAAQLATNLSHAGENRRPAGNLAGQVQGDAGRVGHRRLSDVAAGCLSVRGLHRGQRFQPEHSWAARTAGQTAVGRVARVRSRRRRAASPGRITGMITPFRCW